MNEILNQNSMDESVRVHSNKLSVSGSSSSESGNNEA